MDQYQIDQNVENVEVVETVVPTRKEKKKAFARSLISIIAFTVVSIIIFSAQTVAYFSENRNSGANTIKSGNVDIDLIEMTETANGVVQYTNPVSVMPATSVSKIVSVYNAGTLPVYVRIKVVKTINKDENSVPANWQDMIACNYNVDNEATTDVKEGAWTYYDGYYYYNLPLAAGQSTASLFDTVIFSPAMGNEFTNSQMTMAVICEATQASGNYAAPWQADGWPAATGTN